MEQSDPDVGLLQTVPLYHVQAMVKVRHVPLSLKTQNSVSPSNALASSSLSASTSNEEIARYLFDPASIRQALTELGELEKLILRELVACGGRANSRDMALYLTNGGFLTTGKKPDLLPGMVGPEMQRSYQHGLGLQYPAAHPHGVFEQAVRHLLIQGLLFWGKQTSFAGRDYSSGMHDGLLIVPIAVREIVRAEWRLDEPWTPMETVSMVISREKAEEAGPGDGAVGDVGEGARGLQRMLYLYWSVVANLREGLSVVNTGLLSRSALRQVVEQLGSRLHIEQIRVENDAPYLLFLRLLLTKLDLLQERQGTIYAAPAEDFFALPLLERVRCCYQLCIGTPLWDEMLYLPEVNVRPGPGLLDPAHEEVVRSRQIVVERVLHEAPTIWTDLGAFIARTKLYAPYLLFPRQYGARAERYSSGSNPYGWDFRLRRGWLTHREGWHMVEGGFVRAVVGGVLHWLGLVELDREENPSLFRLSPSAHMIVSDTSVASVDVAWGRLIVQPNFELVALAPVSELLLVTLDRFAERISLEHIAQYRLTKASVTRAIQKGLTAEKIQSELERAAGGEIPQNVRYSLVEWERQARRVEIWQGATLLEVDDAALLDALFAEPETRALFGRRLAPLLAEVAPHQLSAVQDVLWRRSYLPALTPAPSQGATEESGRLDARESQWRLHDDGLLQSFYTVLDLYLASEVARFSERDEVTGWHRITPASLQKALRDGLTLEQVIRFLQHYCEGGIPGSLLIRLKLWGGGYGERQDVWIEQSPMLSLPPHVLEDVRGDEELEQLLGEELEQQNRLVRIEPRHLERLIELLRERGFTIS
jgi:hypothetical protein